MANDAHEKGSAITNAYIRNALFSLIINLDSLFMAPPKFYFFQIILPNKDFDIFERTYQYKPFRRFL